MRGAKGKGEWLEAYIGTAASIDEVTRSIGGLSAEMIEAAKETGNFELAMSEAAKAQRLKLRLENLRKQMDDTASSARVSADVILDILRTPINPNAEGWADGFVSEAERLKEAVNMLKQPGWRGFQVDLFQDTDWLKEVKEGNTNALIEILKTFTGQDPKVQEQAARIEKELQDILSGATLKAATGPGDGKTSAKKSWMAWWEEITKVPQELFEDAKRPGFTAGTLFVEGLENGLAAARNVADALGENFNVAEALKGQQDSIRKTLTELFSIDPKDIDEKFTAINKSVEQLLNQFRENKSALDQLEIDAILADITQKNKELTMSERELALAKFDSIGATEEQIRLAKEQATVKLDEGERITILSSLREEVQGLGKDQYDLALASLAAANATQEQIAEAEELIAKLREAEAEVKSFEEAFTEWAAAGLLEIFPELSKEGARAFAEIGASIASLSFDGMLRGLEEVGRAFAENSNAADAFRDAMAGMLRQMLDMLPALFLQAGLQLIIGGNWPLGLGFIAAAGSSALIGGYVKGVMAREEEEAAEAVTANARGAAYNETFVVPYGRGGEFTSRLISAPTYFRHGGGLGLMGEAGPEAVIPLKRMANGDLGVESSGGSPRVVVNIINNTGEQVRQEESQTGDGDRQLDIIIGEVVGAQIAQGRHDGAFEARFEGLRKRGR
jgi:phage-related minor tail protein